MNLKSSLTASMLFASLKEVQPQQKQDFFNVKKSTRRLKAIFKSSQDTNNDQEINFNPLFNQCKIFKKLQNLDVKQLHHTLAQTDVTQFTLEFKEKQPKKKRISQKINSYNNIMKKSVLISQKNETSSQNILKAQNIVSLKLIGSEKNTLKYQKFPEKEEIDTIKQQLQTQQIQTINKKITSLFSEQTPLYQEQQYPDLSIDDFQIIKQIGQGTYSKVCMAVHKSTGFVCALKILQKSLMKQLRVQQNAIRQIKILSCLSSHPHIVTLFGSFSDSKRIYLIMQLCTDGDLYHKAKQQKKITETAAKNSTNKNNENVNILKQVCYALNQLHENSIIHRDIKPQNVLITFSDNIKLSDFGWAVYNPKNNLRKTLCGTPLYLAPQFIINCQYNDSIDIWSLGIMAYQMFANEFPFKIKSVQDLMKIVQEQINFDKIKCEVIRDFCQRALVRDYRKRATIKQLCGHQIFNIYSKSE